jgi:hypothetical protein
MDRLPDGSAVFHATRDDDRGWWLERAGSDPRQSGGPGRVTAAVFSPSGENTAFSDNLLATGYQNGYFHRSVKS